MEKAHIWRLELKVLTNNLENSNLTLLQIRTSDVQRETTYLLIKQGHSIRESLMVYKGRFCFQ